MRALCSALLGVLLLLSAAGPHVHAGTDAQQASHGAEHCAVCAVRGADVARDATPDVTPRIVALGAAPLEPGVPPVTGAPLGAIPGQSPPCA
jgi:hypothetical protein